jgi:hypothetical protein
MILALRQRHRRMFAVIGILVPFAFAIGIAARKPVPSVATLPTGLKTSERQFSSTEWERGDLFTKSSIQVRLLRESAGVGQFAISFAAPKDFVRPDLIVYWVEGNPPIADTLPDSASLLGSFCSPALVLPTEASKANGVIVLYSMADNEIVDMSKPLSISSEGQVPRGPDHATNNWDSQSSPLRDN